MSMTLYQQLQTKFINFAHRWKRRLSEIKPYHVVQFVTLVILVLSVVGYMLYSTGSFDIRPSAASDPATLKFQPKKLAIAPQTTKVVDVILDGGGYQVTGIELHINSLNSNSVIINDIQTVDPNLSVEVNKSVTPQVAIVSFVPNCASTCPTYSGSQVIAKLTITSAVPGQAQVTFGGSQVSGLGEEANILGIAEPLVVRVR